VALGGIEAYQAASVMGERKKQCGAFQSGKWVTGMMKELKFTSQIVGGARTQQSPVRLLDVGALTDQYAGVKHVSSTMVDLHSRLPCVLEADFVAFARDRLARGLQSRGPNNRGVTEDRPDGTDGCFDVVVLSLVTHT
jgi:hypothetical protein